MSYYLKARTRAKVMGMDKVYKLEKYLMTQPIDVVINCMEHEKKPSS